LEINVTKEFTFNTTQFRFTFNTYQYCMDIQILKPLCNTKTVEMFYGKDLVA